MIFPPGRVSAAKFRAPSPWPERRATSISSGTARLCAANIDTHAVREIIKGRFTAINCDETFAVRTITATDPSGKVQPPQPRTMPAAARADVRRQTQSRHRAVRRRRNRLRARRTASRAACQSVVARRLSSPNLKTGRVGDERLSIRLAESSAVLADRSKSVALLPRRHLARGRSHLDHPHRRLAAAADAQRIDGHGNRRARILELSTARRSGSICKRRGAKSSGWPA